MLRNRLKIAASALGLCFLALLPLGAGAQESGEVANTATVTYSDPGGQTMQNMLTSRMMLIDPRGQVRGCDGALLPDYTGFQIGLYDADVKDPGHVALGALVSLTPTAATPGGSLPPGVEPNGENRNPFALATITQGTFSFLLDAGRGQTAPGRAYVLVLSPPPGSAFRERRILVTIGTSGNGLLSYTAASLDGEPVSGADGRMAFSRYAALQTISGTAMTALNLSVSDCAARPVQITKIGDRATAQPGDTVVYRIEVRNQGTLPLARLVVTDTLPLGFVLRPDSVRAQNGKNPVTLLVSRKERVATFALPPDQTLPANGTISIAYAALLTPSALRGDGRNSAGVSAQTVMTMPGGAAMTSPVSDGPAIYGVQVRQGLLSDTGTLLGRVFQDFSEDGEQQRGEPGIAGVVLLLDDSTQIVTDINGLFSVPTVMAGAHVITLDFSSAPGFVLAPNHRFRERRSPARLIQMEPGGLARVSFGLLPRASQPAAAPTSPAKTQEKQDQ